MRYRVLTNLFILVLGLLPLTWFTPGNLITGTDIDYSPFAIQRLQERLYTWNPNLMAGVDRANNTSSLSYIASSAFFGLFTDSGILIQKLTFVFWYSLTGFAMSFLIDKLFSNKSEKEKFFMKIFAVTFYMINFYNAFLWVRLHLAITSLVFIPIFFGVLLEILDDNRFGLKGAFIASVIAIIGSPLGTQPPIIYVILLCSIVLYVFFLSFDLNNLLILKQKTKKLLVMLLVILLSGAYWILPLGNFIFNSNLSGGSDYGKELFNVESLLQWTSTPTSILNILRNYGDVPWFSGYEGYDYFPEFLEMQESPLFIALSLFVVALVAIGFYQSGKSKKLLGLALLTLVALFFSKGLHEPFTGLFKFLFDNLPGFWIHRAPWQKFGIVSSIGIAVFGSVGALSLVKYVNEKTRLPIYAGYLVILLLYVGANSLFVSGSMFPSKDSNSGYHGHFDLGFHHKFPDYMFQTSDFINSLGLEDYNILLLPEQSTSVYNWGYGGAGDIVNLFLNKSVLFSPYGEGFVVDGFISNVYKDLAILLYVDNSYDLDILFNIYNISYILQRNDFSYDFYKDNDSPAFIEYALTSKGLKNFNTFGLWDLYPVLANNSEIAFTSNYYVDASLLQENILLPFLRSKEKDLLLVDSTNENLPFAEVYFSIAPNYIDRAEVNIPQVLLPEANVSPEDIFYAAVRLREKAEVALSANSYDKATKHLWFLLKRIVELDKYLSLDASTKSSLLGNYDKHLLSFTELLFDEKSDISNENRLDLAFLAKAYFLLIDSQYEVYDDSTFGSYINSLDDLISKLSGIKCVGHCYLVNIPHDGMYVFSALTKRYEDLSLLFGLKVLSSEGVEVYSNKDMSPVFLSRGDYIVNLDGPHMSPIASPVQSRDTNFTYYTFDGIKPLTKYNTKISFSSNNAAPQISFGDIDMFGNYTQLDSIEAEDDGFITVSFDTRSASRSVQLRIESDTTIHAIELFEYIEPNLIASSVSDMEVMNYTPKVEIFKVNPTKYIASFPEGLSNSTSLILNQTFSPHWKVRRLSSLKDALNVNIFNTKGTIISNDRHFKANHYANGWLLDESLYKKGDFLVIEFMPQKIFYLGFYISGTTALLLLGMFVRKKGYKKE